MKSNSKFLKRSALTVALGLCFAGGVHAQSTSGGINGTVASGQGITVVISNNAGFSRTVPVDAQGRYNISSLPIGDYTVTTQRDGQTVGTRNVTVLVGKYIDVSFGDATTLGTITVTGANVPAIDVTSLDTRTVITAEQVRRLPIVPSAQTLALLAPGTNAGAGGIAAFVGLVSFGGVDVPENAYYINGFYTSAPLNNLGGYSLPFAALAQ
jgi:hypothetical protein